MDGRISILIEREIFIDVYCTCGEFLKVTLDKSDDIIAEPCESCCAEAEEVKP